MKNLVLGCTSVLASLHVFEWGWYLRYFGDTENGRVLGMALLLAAIALLLCSLNFGILSGLRVLRENNTDED